MLFGLSPTDPLTYGGVRVASSLAIARWRRSLPARRASRIDPMTALQSRIGPSMLANLRFALRQLVKSPGFAVVALLTLALGIGACTAMFSIVNAVLLRPLPFREPGRLVWIENVGTGGLSARTTRADTFKAWREENTSFEAIAGYFAFFDFGRRQTLTGSGDPERLRSVGVSDNFLDVLGVAVALGRNFTAEECLFNGPPVAILSHAFWQRRFAERPGSRRPPLTMNNAAVTIVGVLPASFDFDAIFAPGQEIELIRPFPIGPGDGAAGQHAVRHRPAEAGRDRRGRAGRPPGDQPALQAVDQLRRHAGRAGPAARRCAARRVPAGVLRAGGCRAVRAGDRLRQPLEPAAGADQRAAAGVRGARGARRGPRAT